MVTTQYELVYVEDMHFLLKFSKPTQGEEFWKKTDYVKLVSAPKRRQSGRPKKQRRKDASEGPSNSGNVRRSYPMLTCSRCVLEGNHNRVACTNQGVMHMPPNWAPPPPPNDASQGE